MPRLTRACAPLIAAVLVMAAAAQPTAQADRTKLATAWAEIDKLFTDYSRPAVPGAAWGVIVDGALVHTGAFGVRDVASNAPADADTVFRIASMTKSFTAVAILKLRDEGKLSLDDPAERYVPELKALKYPTSDSPRLTIRHLLSHAEGFPEDNPWGDRQLARTEDEFTRMLRGGIPFSNAPGVAYEYSNYGFAILGRIVSNVSGRRYEEYVAANVLRPLGMTSTTFEVSKVPAGRLARGYRWEDERLKDEPLLPHGSFGAMGGLLTTVRDLSRYVSVMLSAWPPRDGPETAPIRRASLREMQVVSRTVPASLARAPAGALQLNAPGYGFGLRILQNCSFPHIVMHGGGLPGFGSIMQWLPDRGVGIIAFGNLTYTGWGGVTNAAFDVLAKTGGLAPRAPQASPALVAARDSVSRLVDRWDDTLADDLAAENLFLDRSKDRRRADVERVRGRLGVCTPPSTFAWVENALRGGWTMTCEGGSIQMSVTLAPTMPPKVQSLRVIPAPPPNPSSGGACPQ